MRNPRPAHADEPGTIRFEDIIEGVTVHEEVDEVTGLSRFIIVDSPDKKRQPTIEIKDHRLYDTARRGGGEFRCKEGRLRAALALYDVVLADDVRRPVDCTQSTAPG